MRPIIGAHGLAAGSGDGIRGGPAQAVTSTPCFSRLATGDEALCSVLFVPARTSAILTYLLCYYRHVVLFGRATWAFDLRECAIGDFFFFI